MSGRNQKAPSYSVVFIKSPRESFSCGENLCEEDKEGYVESNLKSSSHDEKKKSSTKTITLCTTCGRNKGCQMRRNLFIILCIAIILLVLLIGIIIVLYAIIPAIVRSTIDKVEFSFRSINIEDIESCRFRLRAELELSRTGSIPATILSPLVINVDNVGTVQNNRSITIAGDSDRSTLVPINSPFIITNLKAFHNFSHSLIFQSKVVWHLTAKASIQPISSAMPIYSNIPFNKEVTLTALNSLQNVGVKSISFHRSNAHQILTDIIIEIPNPSIFSIDLGQPTLYVQST